MSGPAPDDLVTITGEVSHVTYESEESGFRVVKLIDVPGHRGLTLVGVFQPVGVGTTVRASGRLVRDKRHGPQFKAETVVALLPETLEGIEKYLASGVLPGIGAGYAKKIVEKFGTETLKILDEDPERLGRVKGIGAARVAQAVEHWRTQRGMSTVMVLLQTHGASPALAGRILERYGPAAATIVQRTPYRLAHEVRGVGFRTADRIARSLGIQGDHPERVQAGVAHELEELADSGHIRVPRPLLTARSAEMLHVGEDHVASAIDALWASERVVVERDFVYLARLHQAESDVAGYLQRLLDAPAHDLPGLEQAIEGFEKDVGIELADMQRYAVETAAKRKVVVITGGPGVGKTTIVKAILSVFRKSKLTVKLAAPTGRAAKRMAEATGHEATTIHRLLEFEPRLRTFQKNNEAPIETDAVILDEASMIDIPLGDALLAAIPSAARLVVVGDADQLPSVGPGAFLRDLIESDVLPTVRLNQIFRQAEQSNIVMNAHCILRGEEPVGAKDDRDGADFFIIKRRDPEHARDTILELVTKRIPTRFKYDSRKDVQVLTPMHKGAAGTESLNLALQQALNPSGLGLQRRNQITRVGDKVMQTKNDYERQVYNGDIGIVSSVNAATKTLKVRFDERDVAYEDGELDALTLAYATSIHKSQGSEYPVVVLPLLTAHFVMLSRNLIYTAVTRARKLCVLVADPRALSIAVSEIRSEDRMTSLALRLRGELT